MKQAMRRSRYKTMMIVLGSSLAAQLGATDTIIDPRTAQENFGTGYGFGEPVQQTPPTQETESPLDFLSASKRAPDTQATKPSDTALENEPRLFKDANLSCGAKCGVNLSKKNP